MDWNRSSKDTLSAKYYYQHDPSIAPYAYSSVAGFSQHLDAGSQVASLTNTQTLRSNLKRGGSTGNSSRECLQHDRAAASSPQQVGINTFGSSFFPGISDRRPARIVRAGQHRVTYRTTSFLKHSVRGAASQGAFTGVFQNRIMPSANAIWNRGRHTDHVRR